MLPSRRWFLGGLVAAVIAPAGAQALKEEAIDAGALAWDELRESSDALLKLTLDFHAQLEDVDPAALLPLALWKEVRKIEKTARAIQDRLKGEP
ncbi:hypothetical protein [Silvibacterium sp.]|uniref:hypothetical protein n=1 Tax=Silvibacterium sp. TaxID=1964179 RepID=UPI0039E349BE